MPATGNWIINPGNITGSGSTYTVTNLAAGPYSFTVTSAADATCISTATATQTINAQPVAPAVPALGTVTQPTCASATGSFTITNYDSSLTYVITPAGATRTVQGM